MRLMFSLIFFVTSSISFITLEDTTAKKIYFDDLNRPVFAIYHSGWSCKDCFSILENALLYLDSSVHIIIISECSNSIIEKREKEIILRNLVKNRNFYFIDKKSRENSAFFHNYKIERTPALLYVDNQKYFLLLYDTLFSKKRNVKQLSKFIKQKIFNK